MKITAITVQAKNSDRVNIMVDGTYRFSLDIFQVGELGIRVGKDYTEAELLALENESLFGKLYARAREYCMMRLHSSKEMKEYLRRKTRDTRSSQGTVRPGVPPVIAERVYDRLFEKGYINDERFARHWIENRHANKGASRRKLHAELVAKGIERSLIERLLSESIRRDEDELQKVIMKKRSKYPDDQKFVQYLARQGFSFDDIKHALFAD